MLKVTLLRRQIASSGRQAAVFTLCVALSLVTLVSLASFSASVKGSLFQDAQALHAADITVRAHAPLPERLTQRVEALRHDGLVQSARYFDFYSVVRKETGTASLLAELKVVDPGYPFYGELRLASGRPFHQVLTPGNVVVEPLLLDRLGIKVGDRLRVGEATVTVSDVLLSEPDRPVNFFSLGPQLLVNSADLPSLGLFGMGSRVDYVLLLKVLDQRNLDSIAGELKKVSPGGRIQIETYKNADSRVKRFFDNLLFFLNLIGVFTLLLAGVGIQSTLTALIKEQERTIAIMKALGARSGFIIGHYLTLSLVLGGTGILLGLGLSLFLLRFLPEIFRGLIPATVTWSVSFSPIVEGVALGLLVVATFTALPLYRLKDVKPRAILGQEDLALIPKRSTGFIGGTATLIFIGIVLWRVREIVASLYFLFGMVALLLITITLVCGLTRLLRGVRPANLTLRQALRGLFRPRSATGAILVTLSSALSVIFTITLVEKNLDASFVRSFPSDAPNLFFIDIQPGQKEDVSKAVRRNLVYYPVVRGTVSAINSEKIDPEKEREKRGDNLSREFNLTYRETLLPDERVISGESLFHAGWGDLQVSVLDTVVKMHPMKVGDVILFDVQAIPIRARVASIRTRTKSLLTPYFYFVFPEGLLKDAPQTFFAALRVDPGEIGPLQNLVAKAFPNVSSINLTETVAVFARIMERLSVIVRFFTSFSVTAGILLVVGSVFATRLARIREGVYFTILGAKRRFVLSVFLLEGVLIGGGSASIALFLAQVGSLIICRRVLDVPYAPFVWLSLGLAGATVAVVVLVGIGASFSVLGQKPVRFLREQSEE